MLSKRRTTRTPVYLPGGRLKFAAVEMGDRIRCAPHAPRSCVCTIDCLGSLLSAPLHAREKLYNDHNAFGGGRIVEKEHTQEAKEKGMPALARNRTGG